MKMNELYSAGTVITCMLWLVEILKLVKYNTGIYHVDFFGDQHLRTFIIYFISAMDTSVCIRKTTSINPGGDGTDRAKN